MDSPDPNEVLGRLRRGDRDAMTEIYRDHGDAIYNYCYRRTQSWDAAEDLASSVFLELWKSRSRAKIAHGSLRPWLYGIATNLCRNHLRSQQRKQRLNQRLVLVDGTDTADDVIERLDADRFYQQALDRLGELPEADQEVFALVLWENLSYAEAAAALHIPIGTVRSRLNRVRRILRHIASPEEDLDDPTS